MQKKRTKKSEAAKNNTRGSRSGSSKNSNKRGKDSTDSSVAEVIEEKQLARKYEFIGIGLIAVGIISLCGILGLNVGFVGVYFAKFLQYFFGIGSIISALIIIFIGYQYIVKQHGIKYTKKFFGILMMFISLLSVYHHFTIPPGSEILPESLPNGGGLLGGAVLWIIRKFFGVDGGIVILAAGLLISVLLSTTWSLAKGLLKTQETAEKGVAAAKDTAAVVYETAKVVESKVQEQVVEQVQQVHESIQESLQHRRDRKKSFYNQVNDTSFDKIMADEEPPGIANGRTAGSDWTDGVGIQDNPEHWVDDVGLGTAVGLGNSQSVITSLDKGGSSSSSVSPTAGLSDLDNIDSNVWGINSNLTRSKEELAANDTADVDNGDNEIAPRPNYFCIDDDSEEGQLATEQKISNVAESNLDRAINQALNKVQPAASEASRSNESEAADGGDTNQTVTVDKETGEILVNFEQAVDNDIGGNIYQLGDEFTSDGEADNEASEADSDELDESEEDDFHVSAGHGASASDAEEADFAGNVANLDGLDDESSTEDFAEEDSLGESEALDDDYDWTDDDDTDKASDDDLLAVGTLDSTTAQVKGIATRDILSEAAKLHISVKPALPPYMLPKIEDILSKPAKVDNSQLQLEIREKAKLLAETLTNFKVKATVINAMHGPAVTRYEVKPAPGVKVAKIVGLAEDIALNLAAPAVRIDKIAGKAAIGIEVPNEKMESVALREVLERSEFAEAKSKMTVGFGKDISGQAVFGDIGRMPHLLIAGTTGSGKSVCINTIIASILFKAKPDEVKFIMIDPKMVELPVYNGIPHLMVPVVTDAKKAASVLNWAVQEMEKRYGMIAESGVRNIGSYNKLMVEQGIAPKLSSIIIIIDELADLMMVAPHDVEDAICRLAQKARAAGIYLVLATQRPSVNVITGVIKANIPSRISFSLQSAVDSRTILDASGAENLLGKGDMLYSPMGSSKPVRVQGAFVSDEEVQSLVEYIKNQGHDAEANQDIIDFTNRAMEEEENGGKSSNTGSSDQPKRRRNKADTLLREAMSIALSTGKASTEGFRRKFKLGYSTATSLTDTMEELKLIGPAEGSRPREILVTSEEAARILDEYDKQFL